MNSYVGGVLIFHYLRMWLHLEKCVRVWLCRLMPVDLPLNYASFSLSKHGGGQRVSNLLSSPEWATTVHLLSLYLQVAEIIGVSHYTQQNYMERTASLCTEKGHLRN